MVKNLMDVSRGTVETPEALRHLSQMMTKLISEGIPRQHEISKALR